MLFSDTDFGELDASATIMLAGCKGLTCEALDPVGWGALEVKPVDNKK